MNTLRLDPSAAHAAPRAGLGLLDRLLSTLRRSPVAPGPREIAREAAAVRELAWSHLKTDPGFAADLFAAANRHELLDREVS
jgi:hypothetical protein